MTQSELAARCQTANYTTTRVLDTLEKLALVERRKHPTSRRAYQIFLTEQGRALEAEATALAKACNHEFLSALSEAERDLLK
ncbi:MarR family winged helix-turn-helix transcriptional regulator [Photobacterium sp. TY1-4]|uniref:MarR family winged helix-turn-helix transcriptional regulator n=1 Tax=Photobacterium sp. TY1-4 TaxID=2899122 RepID=UPI0021BF2940|nr:MarR family transcriptional regulator [Photobacterium sp. TY1-4]UXI03376.1 MarR family transcriptional regulator [Photobacterium sp. TY1-4]